MTPKPLQVSRCVAALSEGHCPTCDTRLNIMPHKPDPIAYVMAHGDCFCCCVCWVLWTDFHVWITRWQDMRSPDYRGQPSEILDEHPLPTPA